MISLELSGNRRRPPFGIKFSGAPVVLTAGAFLPAPQSVVIFERALPVSAAIILCATLLEL